MDFFLTDLESERLSCAITTRRCPWNLRDNNPKMSYFGYTLLNVIPADNVDFCVQYPMSNPSRSRSRNPYANVTVQFRLKSYHLLMQCDRFLQSNEDQEWVVKLSDWCQCSASCEQKIWYPKSLTVTVCWHSSHSFSFHYFVDFLSQFVGLQMRTRGFDKVEILVTSDYSSFCSKTRGPVLQIRTKSFQKGWDSRHSKLRFLLLEYPRSSLCSKN